MMHADYAEYIQAPITPYRQSILDFLARHIDGGDICDLGSHSVGHYWAMAYIAKAQSWSCLEISEQARTLQQETVERLDADYLLDKYDTTLSYLNVTDARALAYDIVDKLDDIAAFDFLHDQGEGQYDTVIAIESLEIVETETAYAQAFHAARSLLKEGGQLLAVILPYADRNSEIECLCQAGLEGLLNPDRRQTENAVISAGFQDYRIETYTTHMDNYPDAYLLRAIS